MAAEVVTLSHALVSGACGALALAAVIPAAIALLRGL
jgi:hypothetical protein